MPSALNRWSFRGYPLNRSELRVRAMTGVHGVPPLRGNDFVTTGVTGQLYVRKLADSRRIGLELLLTDSGWTGMIPTLLDELALLFADRAQGALVQYHPDGSIRTAQAEVVDWLPADSKANIGALYIGVADFLLADPWFYTPAVVVTGSIPSSPTTVTVTNPGTAYPHGPQGTLTLDLLGPIANPVISNAANGVSVTINVTVAAGTHLVVDCVAFTALNNGVNAIASVQHSGALPFMVLQPGANPLTVTGTGMTGATALTCTFTPAYA
jgi:Siphovirus-type tail component, C-terminal domain